MVDGLCGETPSQGPRGFKFSCAGEKFSARRTAEVKCITEFGPFLLSWRNVTSSPPAQGPGRGQAVRAPNDGSDDKVTVHVDSESVITVR